MIPRQVQKKPSTAAAAAAAAAAKEGSKGGGIGSIGIVQGSGGSRPSLAAGQPIRAAPPPLAPARDPLSSAPLPPPPGAPAQLPPGKRSLPQPEGDERAPSSKKKRRGEEEEEEPDLHGDRHGEDDPPDERADGGDHRMEQDIYDDPSDGGQQQPQQQGMKGGSKKKEKMANRYRYGNYDGYYTYRIADDLEADPRLQLFRKEMFQGKDCLDVGCNSGLVALTIAKLFSPRLIVGVDIDEKLIKQAQHNLHLHFSLMKPRTDGAEELKEKDWNYFPISFPLSCGFVPFVKTRKPFFPYNVELKVMDFVNAPNESDRKYNVVLCLSLTKWIHLNWGDEGLKKAFHKFFDILADDGILILEPQPFSSYNKKAKFHETLKSNLQHLKFKPEDFEKYLLETVGFAAVESLGVSDHSAKGFRRPIYAFKKAKPV